MNPHMRLSPPLRPWPPSQLALGLLSVGLASTLLACATLPAPPSQAAAQGAPDTTLVQPEAAVALTPATTALGTPGANPVHPHYAVAAANPLAADAGLRMLQQGGSALDAAIAVQMVLSLVEPQSSGLGGGAFLLHFDGRQLQAFDGRETAPAAALPTEFLGSNGQPIERMQAIVGGRAVGVPGAVRMLELAHRQHGRLPWAQLFEPAIDLAQQGFAVSPRLAGLLAQERYLQKDPVASAYFFDAQGNPWPAGHWLKNPELAAVLKRIAHLGADGLLQGEVAQAIVNKVQSHPTNPGKLTLQDLAQYRALVREPLCFDHSATRMSPAPTSALAVRICGMPPPSSGALAIGQILGLLDNTPAWQVPLWQPSSWQQPAQQAQWLHLYSEAARLAFADRAQFVADPAFVAAPAGNWQSLLAPQYLAQRARAIATEPAGRAMAPPAPGQPGGIRLSYANSAAQVEAGTSHISVMDAFGNVLAMTTTIEDAFGARQMVNTGHGLGGGFLLNNELTDFSFAPADAAGVPIANRVEPGKRPRSSMAPTLVFDKASGQVLISAGSPGGAVIIHYTAKTLIGMLHWGLTPQAAVNLPNFGTLGGPVFLEVGRFAPEIAQALQARGHKVVETDLPSGLQALSRMPEGLIGGADPRREGVVRGD